MVVAARPRETRPRLNPDARQQNAAYGVRFDAETRPPALIAWYLPAIAISEANASTRYA
jgi:hypothetical protein